MNPHSAVETLNRFFFEGLGNDNFFHVIPHKVTEGLDRLLAVGPMSEVGMIAMEALTFEEYVRIVVQQRYSAILSDYSILMIEWECKNNKITRHRYMYVPCPIPVEAFAEMKPEIALGDFLSEMKRESVLPNYASLGCVRFDFTNDPVGADKYHPMSHMTVISSNCRLALKAPISVGDFLTFVFENFQQSCMPFWKAYKAHLGTVTDNTIRPQESSRIHLNWV